jgi:hypothetical protein
MPIKRGTSAIKANLLNPSLTSHFEVQIPLPPFMQSELESAERIRLNLQCTEASLPGSNIATTEITNDFTGVTERHAYRRMFDESLDFTFYVDGENYIPIKFFEKWMRGVVYEKEDDEVNPLYANYNYRVRYPDEPIGPEGGYTSNGLTITKFEKSFWEKHSGQLQYQFVKAWPKAMNSMPVSYDGSNLLKCTVSMTYVRYVLMGLDSGTISSQATRPPQNSGAGQRGVNPWLDLGIGILNDATGLNVSSQAAQNVIDYFGR